MRRTELRRVSAKRAAGLTKAPHRKRTGPSPAVRKLVIDRDERTCARCGKPIGSGQWSLQHRLARGAGSHDAGFWLHHGQDPAAVPVRHALHGWVLLTTAGGWSPAPLRGVA